MAERRTAPEAEPAPGARDVGVRASEPQSGRHLRIALRAIGVMLALVAGLNALVDPFGAYPRTGLDGLEAYTRERRSRTFKAELLQRAHPRLVLLGSSRVEVGLDPGSVSLPRAERAPGAINLGLGGTNLIELGVVFDQVLAQPSVRTVVLGVDLVLFGDDRRTGYDFAQSRFAPGLSPFEYHVDNLLSVRALAASRKKLSAALRGEPAPTDAYGFRSSLRLRTNVRQRIHDLIAVFATRQFGDYRYTEERPALLAHMAQKARERGVRLVVVINPVHLSQLAMIDQLGLRDTFERFKRDVAGVSGGGVLVFDGALAHGYTAEPIPDEGPMEWWWESSHFRSELGDRLLAALFAGGATDPSGVPLLVPIDASTVDAHLARERERLRAQLLARPGLERWVGGIVQAAAAGDASTAR